jgi:hypothetical protein
MCSYNGRHCHSPAYLRDCPHPSREVRHTSIQCWQYVKDVFVWLMTFLLLASMLCSGVGSISGWHSRCARPPW